MKVTQLTTYAVPPRWLFLKIETNEGIVGWGEPVVEGRAATVATCVEELSDAEGFVTIPSGHGLGIDINEDYVRERAQEGPRWRNPIWRHTDGSIAEW
jgi:L-alanine-DL-glutamate epimerase-like enolase superfamily enzyme